MKYTSIQVHDEEEAAPLFQAKQKVTGCFSKIYEAVSDKPRIPYNDRFMLSPWQVYEISSNYVSILFSFYEFAHSMEKWKKYRRFPWKIILHVAIMLLCTFQVPVSSAIFTYTF